MTEIWKDVVGYEKFYKVSNLGRVKSLTRKIKKLDRFGIEIYYNVKEKLLKPCINGNGYMLVGLCKDNKRISHNVHRLVALSFIDNKKNYPCVNHIDGNKQNNSVNNLEWCTNSQNSIHAHSNGLIKYQIGENSHRCKFSDETIKKLKEDYLSGNYNYTEIAKKYNMSRQYATELIKFKKRKYLDV